MKGDREVKKNMPQILSEAEGTRSYSLERQAKNSKKRRIS